MLTCLKQLVHLFEQHRLPVTLWVMVFLNKLCDFFVATVSADEVGPVLAVIKMTLPGSFKTVIAGCGRDVSRCVQVNENAVKRAVARTAFTDIVK